MKKNIIKRMLVVLLAFVLAVSGSIVKMPYAEAGTRTEVQQTDPLYVLRVGFQPVEKAGGKWMNGTWGKVFSNVKSSCELPVYYPTEPGAKVVKYEVESVEWYRPSMGFEFGVNCYSTVTHLTPTKQDFDDRYGTYNTTSLSVTSFTKGDVTKDRKVDYTFSAMMYNEAKTELWQVANEEGATKAWSKVLDKVGDELETNDPKSYKALNSVINDGVAGANEGRHLLYPVFTPIVIKYIVYVEKEIPDDVFEAKLDVPEIVKQGTDYSVKDATIVGDSISFKSGELTRRINGGAWEHVATWTQDGVTKGQNSGKSISHNYPSVAAIEYHLEAVADNGQESSCSATVSIVDARDVSGKAKLDIPSFTYEGHTINATDRSTFTVGGKSYAAVRGYAEELATNEVFVDSGFGWEKRTGDTTFDVTLTQEGKEYVTLEVYPLNGGTLTDKKPIDVKRTPCVLASLSGTLKQNRKIELRADIATNPSFPVADWKVVIKNLTHPGKEEITLTPSVTQSNTEYFKAREITYTVNQDKCFAHLNLDFLTKYDTEQEFSYTIYVKDVRGYEDEVTENFTVAPDLAPEASLLLDSSYLRDAGSNKAQITVSDNSTTDGDQLERTWYFIEADPKDDTYDGVSGEQSSRTDKAQYAGSVITSESEGYRDLSFGAGQEISFTKKGVGKFIVGVKVKDKWTEETLPEFVTAKDYKESYIEMESQVDNVAPIVSVEPIDYMKADIVMLTGDSDAFSKLTSMQTAIKAELLAEGIIPSISVVNSDVIPSELWTSAQQKQSDRVVWETVKSHGYTGVFSGKDMDNHYWFTADDDTVYTVEGTWNVNYESGGSKHYTISMPYTLEAFDIATGTRKWSVKMTETNLACGGSVNNHFAVDKNGKYLLFNGNTETLIINKSTGQFLGKIKDCTGDEVYAFDDSIYYVKSDGLYRAGSGLTPQKIYSGNVVMHSGYTDYGGATLLRNASINFVTLDEGKVKKVSYALSGGDFTYHTLAGFNKKITGANILGWDSEGKLVLGTAFPDGVTAVYCYTNEGELISRIDDIEYRSVVTDSVLYNGTHYYSTNVAYNEKGVINYITTIRNIEDYWGDYDTYFSCYDIYTKECVSSSLHRDCSSSDGPMGDASRAIGSEEAGGKVYLLTGQWFSTGGHGQSMYSMGYYSNTECFVFDPKAKTASRQSGLVNLYQHNDYQGASLLDKVNESYTGGFDTDYYIGRSKVFNDAVSNYYTDSELAEKKITPQGKQGYLTQRNMSLDDILSDVIYKKIRQGSDIPSAFVVYNGENGEPLSVKSMEKTSGAVADSEASLIVEEGEKNSGYIAKIIEGVTAFGKEVISYLSIDNIAETLISFFKSGQTEKDVVKVEAESNASIEKECSFEPGHIYYYEVSESAESPGFSGQVSVTADYTSKADADELTGKQYVVTEDHLESFSDAGSLDPVFGFKTCSNGYHTVSSSVEDYHYSYYYRGQWYYGVFAESFNVNVPAGCVASFSFDVIPTDTHYTAGPTAVIYDEKGNEVDRIELTTSRKTFESKVLLPEGKNTVTIRRYEERDYDNDIEPMKIDNVHAVFYKADTNSAYSSAKVSQNLGLTSNVSAKDGFSVVNGSFYTPYLEYPVLKEQKSGTVSNYNIKDVSEYSGPSGDSSFSILKADPIYRNGQTYNLTIPDGKVTAGVKVDAKATKAYVYQDSGNTWKTVASGYADIDGNHLTFTNIPKNNTVYGEGATASLVSTKILGSRAFSGYSSSTYNRWGDVLLTNFQIDITGINAVYTDKTAFIEDGEYYIGDVNKDKNYEVLIKDGITNGKVKVIIPLKKGIHYIKDVNIYYLDENGKRVYCEDSFTAKDKLNTWSFKNCTAIRTSFTNAKETADDPKMVYKKGEYIDYKVYYTDYESDPKQKDYWIYAHEAYNDGTFENAGIVINEEDEVIAIAGFDLNPGLFDLGEAASLIRAFGHIRCLDEREAAEALIARKLGAGTKSAGLISALASSAEGYLLSEPVHRFYTDGHYYALYFAIDCTLGNGLSSPPATASPWDKASDAAKVSFYIMGESASAPYIVSIVTDPEAPEEGSLVKTKTSINDREKDELSLTVEIYKDRQRIQRQKWTGLKADSSGIYPVSVTPAFTGEEGVYEVVATVRDATGVGLGSLTFRIGGTTGLQGMVSHTATWEKNRQSYNKAKAGKFSTKAAQLTSGTVSGYNGIVDFATYRKLANPRPHFANVFWSGEKFVLSAEVKGKPKKVTVRVKDGGLGSSAGTSGKKKLSEIPAVVMKAAGVGTAGSVNGTGTAGSVKTTLYSGEMWQEDFAWRFGLNEPEEVTFVFTAEYAGGKSESCQVSVIVDNQTPYGLYHRVR